MSENMAVRPIPEKRPSIRQSVHLGDSQHENAIVSERDNTEAIKQNGVPNIK